MKNETHFISDRMTGDLGPSLVTSDYLDLFENEEPLPVFNSKPLAYCNSKNNIIGGGRISNIRAATTTTYIHTTNYNKENDN